MKPLTRFTLVLVLATCLHAQAPKDDPGGWQLAKWGMTEDQVMTALQKYSPRRSGAADGGIPRILIDAYEMAGHSCRITLIHGKDGGLMRIGISPSEKTPQVFSDLRKAMIEKHGEPTASKEQSGLLLTRTVTWELHSTSVELKLVFSPTMGGTGVLSLFYELKRAPENEQMHAILAKNSISPASGKWVASERTDALTGVKRMEFTLEGKYTEQPRRNTETPFIEIRCSAGRRSASKGYTGGQFLEGYVNFGVMADSQSGGIPVHYRINDGKVIDQLWSRSTTFHAGFFGEKELASFLFGKRGLVREGEAVAPGRKLVIATTEYLGSQIVVQFEMPDSTQVAESCGLVIHDIK